MMTTQTSTCGEEWVPKVKEEQTKIDLAQKGTEKLKRRNEDGVSTSVDQWGESDKTEIRDTRRELFRWSHRHAGLTLQLLFPADDNETGAGTVMPGRYGENKFDRWGAMKASEVTALTTAWSKIAFLAVFIGIKIKLTCFVVIFFVMRWFRLFITKGAGRKFKAMQWRASLSCWIRHSE